MTDRGKGAGAELRRVLGPHEASWIVAGNMIGAGIFYSPGLVAGTLPGLWPPLLAWAAGGVLALAGALVYAELGSRMPRAGGDYQYLSEAFGPFWGFLTGWAGMLLTFSAAVSVMVLVALDYLASAASTLSGREVVLPAWFAGSLAVLLLTWTNTVGVRVAGRATIWLTALPLAGLLALFGIGMATARSAEAPVVSQAAPPPAEGWLVAAGLAMLPVFFTYSGWNAAAYLAGEIREPRRNLPRGLVQGTALVTAVYLTMNLVLLRSVPRAELAGSTTAAAEAARQLGGGIAEGLLSLMVALAVLGSANVTLMAGARVYYAMARDGMAPRRLAAVNAAGVPHGALWASGAWAALLTLSDRVGLLLDWATLAILLLSSMAAASLFRLRRRDPDASAFRCPGYPWTPAIYLMASAAVATASAVQYPLRSLYGLLIVGTGIPAYFVFARSGSSAARTPDPRDESASR